MPLHLLQNNMQKAYQAQHQGPTIAAGGFVFEPPELYEAVTVENISTQIGLVRDFFRKKLRENHEEPLVEDEELPQKQRFPKPRLPPTGKISSPRKRPLREQQLMAKKKRKMEDKSGEVEDEGGGGGGSVKKLGKPVGALKLKMPERRDVEEPEKEGEVNGAMISPESIDGK